MMTDQKRMFFYALLAALLGVALGNILKIPGVRLVIPFLLFIMLFPSFLDIELRDIPAIILKPGLLISALVINFVLCPLIIFTLVRVFPISHHPLLVAGVLLFGLIPCAGMGPAYTRFLNGNINLTVTITALSLFITIGVVPLWINLLIGRSIQVPMLLIMKYLAVIIFIPFCLAGVTRRFLIKKRGFAAFDRIKKRGQSIAGPALILMMFILSFLNGKRICSEPLIVLEILLPSLSFMIILLMFSSFISRLLRWRRADSAAFIVSTTTKNNAISITIALLAFGPEGALANAITGPLVQAPLMLLYISLIMSRIKA
jgi:arsenite transporter